MMTKVEATARVNSLLEKRVIGCEKCGGEWAKHDCHCMENHRYNSLQILARIPEEYHTYTLNGYVSRIAEGDPARDRLFKVVKYVNEYADAESWDKGLSFLGRRGCGKTFLATHCMSRVMYETFPKHVQNTYCTMSDILLAFNAGGNNDSRKSLHDQSDFYKGILVIDDIGREFLFGWKGIDVDYRRYGLILNEILRRRIESKLLTFVCSDLSLQYIGKCYGESVQETIASMTEPLIFEDDFPNLRSYEDGYLKKEEGVRF